MSQTTDLPLQLLHDSEAYQPRVDGLDSEHLTRLRETDPVEWPPLIVRPNTVGGYDVLDGFHRLAVARELKLVTLRCDVQHDEDALTALLTAFEANSRHGLPLTLKDRKAFARRLYALVPDLSWAELGALAGLSDKTAKAAITSHSEIPRQASKERQDAHSALGRALRPLIRLDYDLTTRDAQNQLLAEWVREIGSYSEVNEVAEWLESLSAFLTRAARQVLASQHAPAPVSL